MSEYYVGLDVGTESIGWAVADTEYKIQKKNGKALWGVRLFDEAEKAADRRGFRTARRRLERRKQRIEWLREIFSEEIAKVDPAFFLRLDESKFLEEDKRQTENGQQLGRYTLFADKTYCDKDYHKDYPTIYHLRKALLLEDKEFDVRLVYLAVHHILKNRGHFLFGDMRLEDVSFEACLEQLNAYLREEYEEEITLADPLRFKDILTDCTLGVSKKKALLTEAADLDKKNEEHKHLRVLIDMLAGASVKASDVVQISLSKEDEKKISFKNFSEDDEAELAGLLGERAQLIQEAKRLYDWSVLAELRDGEQYLSSAKVKVYDRHQADLKLLKKLFRSNRKLYNEVFRKAENKLNNYPAYSGHGAANYRCGYDDFKKYVKNQITALTKDLDDQGKETAKSIVEMLELGTFLPKQTSKDNGVIPHQLHEQELALILDRAGVYLPFLNEKDASGMNRKEQILAVFRFRIPYYVGPLTDRGTHDAEKSDKKKKAEIKPHSWIVRGEQKIYPWNFEQVVDLEKSAENFITRMTATCSYIGEPVLPKDSLLYSRFVALNMLNKIKINGHGISVETKQRIFTDHVLEDGRSNFAQLKRFMLANGMMEKSDELSGVDKEFKVTLTGYKTFRSILSRTHDEEMVESIIKHIVLFGEDRRLFGRWLDKNCSEKLPQEDRAYVMRQIGRFSGWGNLSREFLTEIQSNGVSIIDALWQTNENLMELLSDRYAYAEAVDEYRKEKLGLRQQTLDEVLEDSYASPGIRRAIRQTIGIISEIEKIMGGKPKRVFVEMARGGGTEGKRTLSRKKQLSDLYAVCKKDAPEVFAQLDDYDDAALRSTKLYLYFLQQGKCMYSGDAIDLSHMGDYDIDHIYPQSIIKDDSLNNRVLVKKQLNAQKSNHLLSDDIRKKMRPFWTMLKAKGFISEEKYHRLTRNKPFDDNELSGFIARQLVETQQSSKIIADLLERRYGDETEIVYVKAGNVSSFRQDQRILPDGTQAQAYACRKMETKQDPLFVKCREVNDFHHAKDAYLNIVVGNVYHVKFTRNPLNFIKKRQEYSLNRMFDFDVVRGGECAWHKGDNGSIAMVRRMMHKNNVLYTKYVQETTGALFDCTPVSKDKCQGKSDKAMIKSKDPRMETAKYGGHDKISGTYFCLVEHMIEKKRIRSIEAIMMIDKEEYEADPVAYCKRAFKYKEPRVLIRRIRVGQLFMFNGFRMYIASRSNDNIFYDNANQLIIPSEWNPYIKQLVKQKESGLLSRIVTREQNIALYDLLLEKLQGTMYRVKYETPIKHLVNHREDFADASLIIQNIILLEILHLFSTSGLSADLRQIGGKKTGQVTLTKNIDISGKYTFKLINQSITGVFEQEIDLLGDFT